MACDYRQGLCWDQQACEGGDPIIDDAECNIFEPNNVKPVVDDAVTTQVHTQAASCLWLLGLL